MEWISVKERVPILGDYYYCKVDTKRDCIIKAIVEFGQYPNGNYDWDLKGSTHWKEFGEESEVIEWLDEQALSNKKVLVVGGHEPSSSLIESLISGIEAKTGEKVEIVNIHSKDTEFLTRRIEHKSLPIELGKIDLQIPYGYIDKHNHKRKSSREI